MPNRPARATVAFMLPVPVAPTLGEVPAVGPPAAQEPPGTRQRPRRSGRRRSGSAVNRTVAPRKPHAIDRALDYHALEKQPGTSQADIARRHGTSPSSVSVLCRVGLAIAPLSQEERAALRVPHVTYKALQLLVSRHKGPDVLREALVAFGARVPRPRARSRIGGTGFWTGKSPTDPADAPIDPLPRARRGAAATTWSYHLDPTAWRADPEGAMEAFEAFVRDMTDGVMREATQALGVGQSMVNELVPGGRSGFSPTGRPRNETPAQRAARVAALDLSLRRLVDRIDALTKSQRAQLAAFEADRAARRSPVKRSGGFSEGRAMTAARVDQTEIDEDLAD